MKHTISFVLLSISFFVHAQSLDPTFGSNGGIVVNQTLNTPPDDYVKNAVLQPDDNLLVISNNVSTGVGSLSRITPQGFLDSTFNNYGFRNFGRLQAIALQGDGKILVASGNTIYRVNTDGSMDASFNATGNQQIMINNFAMNIYAIAVKNNGKILLAGSVSNGTNNDLALASLNTDGSFDTFFDFDGKATLDIAQQNNDASGLAIQADGKIVVCGMAYNGTLQQLMLARFTAVGSLDTTFSSVGYTISDQALPHYPHAIALQTDGKVLVTGAYTVNKLFVMRYTTTGSLDATFATNGYLATNFFNYSSSNYLTNTYINCSRILSLSNGKILLSTNVINNGFGLIQLNANGSLDSTFGVNGVVSQTVGTDRSRFLGINSTGKIVTGGFSIGEGIEKLVYSTTGFYESEVNVHLLQSDEKIIAYYEQSSGKTIALTKDSRLIRYNTNGTIDTTFGVNGVVDISTINSNFSLYNLQKNVVIFGDQFFITGRTVINNIYLPVLIKLNAEGQLDTSFGTAGYVTITGEGLIPDYEFIDVLKLIDDKIYLGYDYYTLEGIANNYNAFYGIMRLNIDGSIDTSFGNAGVIFKNFNHYTQSGEFPFDIIKDPNNKIIVTGGLFEQLGNYRRAIGTMRLNNDGSFDQSFGNNGALITDSTSSRNYALDLFVTNNNKYVLNSVTTELNGQSHNTLIQLNNDGTYDTTFATNGLLSLPNYNAYNSIIIQSDHKILVANNTNNQFGITRFNSTGSIDSSFGTNGQLTTPIYYFSNVNSMLFLQNGKLLVGGSAYNGSSNVLAQARYINLNLSNPEFDQAEQVVSVYPNPVSSNFVVRSSSQLASSLSVVNLLGQEVFHTTLQGSETQIDKTWPGSGLYLVKIYDTNKQLVETHKVLFE